MRSTPFYIIGNWKSNKTIDEAVVWFKEFESLWKTMPFVLSQTTIILCPSFIHLRVLKSLIDLSSLAHVLHLGAQTLSSSKQGAYTGEIAATQMKDLVEYAIVGHSERREHFGETDAMLEQKLTQAHENGIKTIYCVQDKDQSIPQNCDLLAYEPVWAIGTGKPATIEHAHEVAEHLKAKSGRNLGIIYGGSVTHENVHDYAADEKLSGVLPGGASLKPGDFYNLIKSAVQ